MRDIILTQDQLRIENKQPKFVNDQEKTKTSKQFLFFFLTHEMIVFSVLV